MKPDLSHLLSQKSNLHFVGVGGSGMYPLVQILLSQGHSIQGSDVNEGSILQAERRAGVRVMMHQKAEHVHGVDLVIYSAAISPDNPERKEAERLGIPCIERSVLLGYVTSLYQKSVCIAGTHGKTTATGMCVQILEQAGLDPAAVIGGKLPLIGGYGKQGNGERIVVEACEYHHTFLQLWPTTAVLLNIDSDHLEYFGNLQNLQKAFHDFCKQATECIIFNADDEKSIIAMQGLSQKKVGFAIENEAEVRATHLDETRPAYFSFDIEENDQFQARVNLSVPGRHNVYNALAAYAAARAAGAKVKACCEGLASFRGTGRRFEILGKRNGVTVADDYAHHPAELHATLGAAMDMDYHAVWAVFQPYTFTRTEQHLSEFASALSRADHVVMTAIMGGREREQDYNITTEELAKRIDNSVWFETQEEVARYVMEHAAEGDLVLTLGCGDIYKCAHMMLQD